MSTKISLEYPILIGGESVSELALQRLKVKDLKILPASFFSEDSTPTPQEMAPIISAITGITEDQAGDIDLADLVTASEVIGSFLETCLQTGKK